MLTSLYQRHGRWLLIIALIAFPFVYWEAESIPSNNDLETWLPKESEVRTTYDMFKEEFELRKSSLSDCRTSTRMILLWSLSLND